jgi:hypothetical protein
MTQLKALLQHLSDRHVDFILAGGIAESLYGSDIAAIKMEIICASESANLDRLRWALATIHARERGEPANHAFELKGLASGWCYRLATNLGNLDVSDEIAGVGGYAEACKDAVLMHLSGKDYLVLSVQGLMSARRVSGRHL